METPNTSETDRLSPKGDGPDVAAPRRGIRGELTSLPNLLTFSRIFMIPPVIWLMLQDTPTTNWWAAIVFGVAAITDWLDGFLARRQNLVSVLGKFLDPLADKLIVMATLIIAAQMGRVPGWFVVVLLSREVAITGLRGLASQEGFSLDVVKAGKFKTAFQLIGLVCILLNAVWVLPIGDGLALDLNVIGMATLGVAMFFSLWSAVVYFARFVRSLGS